MRHNIITTENYLLVVDDSEIKYKTWYLDDANQVRQCVVLDTDYWKSRKDYKKIIAHLPKNSPILEGVDLLPPLEDEVENLAEEWNDKGEFTSPYSFKAGYNKAKEKYKYTEEDMCNFIEFVRNNYTGFGSPNLIYNKGGQEKTTQIFDRYVVALQQPKMPVGFGCEIEYIGFQEEGDLVEPKSFINSQGLTQWVGEYIYE